MRRPTILVLCSALAPAAAFFAGCLGSNSSVPPHDAGPGFDSAFPPITVSTADGSVPGATLDGAPPDTGTPDDAGPPATSLASTPIDFGLVNCGAVPAAKSVTFTNTGGTPLTYSASLASGAYFAIQGAASGTLAPGATGTLSLAPPALPVTLTAGTPVTDTLQLTTNVPGFTSISLPVTVTPQGGSLVVSPDPASFGQIFVSDQAPSIPVALVNVGNAPVTVSVGAPANGDFGFAYAGSPAGVSLAPDAGLPDASAQFKPTVAALESTSAPITATGPLCASAATTVPMNGTGTYAQVTVTPGTLPFGSTSCGAPAAAQRTVTIHNAYNYAITYSSALKAGAASPYTLTGGSGSVPANGSATITVTPKAIAAPASVAPGAFDDTLTVTPVAPGVTATAVALTQSATGAILAVTMVKKDFADVNVNQTGTLAFSVANAGNVTAPLAIATTGAGFGASFTTPPSAAPDGGTAGGNATFSPPALGGASGTLKVSTTAAQCGAAPAAIDLTANGIGPVAVVPAATVDFAVTCGSAGSASQGVTISNATGTAPLVLSNVKSVNGLFSIVSTPGSIPAGSSGTIMIAAKAAVVGSVLGGQSYADTLSFTTNELHSPTRTVPVSVAVSGANLEFVDGSGNPFNGVITFTTCSPTTAFGVKNTGNMTALVTAPTSSGNASVMLDGTFVKGASIAAGATATESAHGFSNGSAACSGTDVYVYTEAAGDAVCEQLPGASGQQELQVVYNYDVSACQNGACC